MTQADAMLRDALDHPHDDAPRLVYADWLDEQGETRRAAFVRAEPFPAIRSCTYRIAGGAVARVKLPGAAFLRHAASLFAAHPVAAVTLTDCEPQAVRPYEGARPIGRVWYLALCQRRFRRGRNARHFLPIQFRPLADLSLPPEEVGRSTLPLGLYAYFRTRKDAHDALSQVCVAWGRARGERRLQKFKQDPAAELRAYCRRLEAENARLRERLKRVNAAQKAA